MQTHPTRYPTDLTDEEWNQILSLVPSPKSGKGKRGRPPALDRRSLVNAIFYVVRSGCAWRLLPSDFGPWQTVYGYFRRWSQDWTWKFIHDTLRDWLRKGGIAVRRVAIHTPYGFTAPMKQVRWASRRLAHNGAVIGIHDGFKEVHGRYRDSAAVEFSSPTRARKADATLRPSEFAVELAFPSHPA